MRYFLVLVLILGCKAPQGAQDASWEMTPPPVEGLTQAQYEVESPSRIHIWASPIGGYTAVRWYFLTGPRIQWTETYLWGGYTLPPWNVHVEGLKPGVRTRALLQCTDWEGSLVWVADVLVQMPEERAEMQWPHVGEVTIFEAIGIPPKMRIPAFDSTAIARCDILVNGPDGVVHEAMVPGPQALRAWPHGFASRFEWRFDPYFRGRFHTEITVMDVYWNAYTLVDTFTY